MRILNHLIAFALYLLLSATAWYLVYYFIVVRDVGAISSFTDPSRILAYVAFIAAPAITFIPLARLLRIPLFDLEAITAWAMLAYVLTFIDPGEQPSRAEMLLFLISSMMALATLFTLASYLIGLRLFSRRSQRRDSVRARREGYLLAMFVVGSMLLSTVGALTPVNAALLGLITALFEIFWLSRGNTREQAPRVRG